MPTKEAVESFGAIAACQNHTNHCNYKCCTFTDNYIVLHPGEYEGSALNKSHLHIIDDDYFGGKRAVCLRPCTDADFKPLDCKTYPYFPTVDEDGNLRLLRGSKCPLTKKQIAEHRKQLLDIWGRLIQDRTIREWVTKVELVGYEPDE